MNKKIKIIPFHLEHLDWIDIRKHEMENVFCIKNYEEILKNLEEQSVVSLTIFYDNRIICIVGVYEKYKGVCEIWLIPSTTVAQNGLVFARLMKKLLNQIWEMEYYHRIQVTALNDDLHNRFFKWLEFDLETPNGMKNFTIKKCNYNLWSRTK